MEEKELNKIVECFLSQFSQVEQVLTSYSLGDTSYHQVSAELNHLIRISSQMQIAMGDGIRDLNTRARDIRRKRIGKNIEELGYQP